MCTLSSIICGKMRFVVFPSGDGLFRASPQLTCSATVTSTQGEKNVVLHDTGDLKQTCEHYRPSLPIPKPHLV